VMQGRTPLWQGTSLGGVVIVNTELLANASGTRSVRLEFVMQGRTPLWRGTSLGGVVIVNAVHPNRYASTSRSGGYIPATRLCEAEPAFLRGGGGSDPLVTS